jgi:hypothetical protein
MTTRFTGLKTALASATLLALGACGSDDAPTTTALTTTVIDGAIGNALVCVDKNTNNSCDSDETQGRSDADGKVTLAVPNADAGRPRHDRDRRRDDHASHLDEIVQMKLLELLPSIVGAAAAPAVRAAASPADAEAAITAAVTALVASEGLTAAGAANVGAVNTQAPAPAAAASTAASMQLMSLNHTSGTSNALRVLTSTQAQSTPDADNEVRYVDRRQRMVAGQLATWGSGSDPWRNARRSSTPSQPPRC